MVVCDQGFFTWQYEGKGFRNSGPKSVWVGVGVGMGSCVFLYVCVSGWVGGWGLCSGDPLYFTKA